MKAFILRDMVMIGEFMTSKSISKVILADSINEAAAKAGVSFFTGKHYNYDSRIAGSCSWVMDKGIEYLLEEVPLVE